MTITKAEKNKTDETVQKKKKRKVSVDNQVIIDNDENNRDGCSDLPKKAKVKKKKDALKRKYSHQEGTKKKKKEKSDSGIKNKTCVNLPIIIESSSDSEVVTQNRKISKIHKKKAKERLCEGGDICEALRQFSKRKDLSSHGESAECIEKRKKKKKKHKATCSLMLHSENNEVESQKQSILNGEAISQGAASPGRKKRQTLVKNKAQKGKLVSLDNKGSKDGIPEKRNASSVYQLQGGNDCKRTLGCKPHQDSVAQVSEEETGVNRKKRKKNKPQNEKVSFATSSKKQHTKKRKNMDRGNADNCEEEPSLKKGRWKKETEVREDDIKVVAFKKGNCDEINIDKSRRQALQEEIDRVSGKTKATEEEGEWGRHFGQWGTAAFGSSERKDKFLRLLGGFKRSSPAHAPKPNMALDWKKEQSLQRDLQTEFETAVNRKHHRSIGLGFPPAAQKHMQIDKYASKSIKFED